ncbi:MAG: hypothetical protein WC005_10535 [Candidatus Nanopelagicales bacterium]
MTQRLLGCETPSGDLAAVSGHGKDARDCENAKAPGQGDPDVGADWPLCEQVADRVAGGRRRLVLGEGTRRAGPGMVSVSTNAELMNGRKMDG